MGPVTGHAGCRGGRGGAVGIKRGHSLVAPVLVLLCLDCTCFMIKKIKTMQVVPCHTF